MCMCTCMCMRAYVSVYTRACVCAYQTFKTQSVRDNQFVHPTCNFKYSPFKRISVVYNTHNTRPSHNTRQSATPALRSLLSLSLGSLALTLPIFSLPLSISQSRSISLSFSTDTATRTRTHTDTHGNKIVEHTRTFTRFVVVLGSLEFALPVFPLKPHSTM